MSLNHFKSSGRYTLSLLFLCLIIPLTTSARQADPFHSYPTYTYPELRLSPPAEGTLHIVAVMAEFQPDTNRFTSGNGTFGPGSVPYLENPGTSVDAIPHNRSYFESHLEFVKNYFESMSGELLEIEYFVIPDPVRLPREMAYYSPIGEDPELDILAELAKDAWERVNENESPVPAIQPGENVAFVVFHAGIGRDIELTGTTLNRTPQDIPSIYLGTGALSRMLGDPAFSGFPIDNGNLLVSNTVIVPRTLSRAGEDLSGDRFVLPLSVNGMVTAQIGSHLGLPDLFNTETGESGIGRFGLMDGAGIFALNGLFPPEMSAWEKYYLGWAEPFEIDTGLESSISLPAASLRQEGSIAKINISSEEYFLVENRHRDPDDTGVTITIKQPDGSYIDQTFTNSDTGFTDRQSDFDRHLTPGVITDVSHYDFALPGGRDEQGDRNLNGGVLIWHIDESVIRQHIDHRGINDNPERRGVQLIEADGARDIGRPVTAGLFENPVNGSAFDFWWSGNDATVVTQSGSVTLYQNRFGPDTTPPSRSNSGAPSHFELYNFSDNLPVAGFNIRPVDPFGDLYSLVANLTGLTVQSSVQAGDPYWSSYPLSLFPIEDVESPTLLIPGSDGVQAYSLQTQSLSPAFTDPGTLQQPLYFDNLNRFFFAPNPDLSASGMNVITALWNGQEFQKETEFSTLPNPGNLSQSGQNFVDFDGTRNRYNISLQQVETDDEGITFRTVSVGDYKAYLKDDQFIILYPGGTASHVINRENNFDRFHAGIINRQNRPPMFYLLQDRSLNIFTPEDQYSRPVSLVKERSIERPAVVSLQEDGEPDFIYVNLADNNLTALNRNGAMLDFFPIQPPPGVTFAGTPVVADIDGNGELNLVVAGVDQYSLNLYAYHLSGDPVEGFPLLAGGMADGTSRPVNPVIFERYLAAASPAGDLKIWEFPGLQQIKWSSAYGNSTDNKSSASLSSPAVSEPDFSILNRKETYNWPNPARNETYIRYQTDEPAEVQIKITTLSGRTIYSRTLQSRGGVPEEITVDTSSWGSGGYFALVTVKRAGQTERKLINIAIAK